MNSNQAERRERDRNPKTVGTVDPSNGSLPFGIVEADEESESPLPSFGGVGEPPSVEAPPLASPEPSPDPWDLNSLKISQDFASASGVKKLLTVVPVRKPDATWFVRAHPEHSLTTAVIELKEDRETYLVLPKLWPELATEKTFSPRMLVLSMNRNGNPFIWPVKLPGPDGKIDSWSLSSLDAVGLARTRWVRVMSNMGLGAYEVFESSAALPPPSWPDMPFQQLIKLAFRDKMIDSLDHPVLRRLRGEI